MGGGGRGGDVAMRPRPPRPAHARHLETVSASSSDGPASTGGVPFNSCTSDALWNRPLVGWGTAAVLATMEPGACQLAGRVIRVVPMPCDMTAKDHLENCPMRIRLCPRACVNRLALHRANGPTTPRPTSRSQHPPLATRLTPGVRRTGDTQQRHAVTRGGDDAC